MNVLLTALGCVAFLSIVPAIAWFMTLSWSQTLDATLEYLATIGIIVGTGVLLAICDILLGIT